MKFNDYFDKVYVLTLKDNIIRQNNIKKIFDNLNINFEFWYATNGEDYKKDFEKYFTSPITKDSHYYDIKNNKKSIRTCGTWGILKSYKKMFEYAIKHNLKNFVCFQDDVNFIKDFNYEFEKNSHLFDKSTNNWALIKFGASQYDWSNINCINNCYYSPKNCDGAFAVAYNRFVFEEILDKINLFNCSYDSGPLQDIQYKYKNKCFVFYPNLVIADVSQSTTDKKRDLLNHSELMKWNLYDYNLSNLLIKVSIIVVCYNAQNTIRFSLDSLLNQTYKYIEIIIVDDCSTDRTNFICEEYQKNHTNVFYYRNETNKGCYYSRNKGIQNSTGSYITFQDADDISLSNRIDTQLQYALKNNCSISLVNCYRSNLTPQNFNDINLTKHNIFDLFKSYDKDQIMLATVTTFIDRKVFLKYGLYREDSRHSSDIEFLERIYCLEYQDNPYLIDNMWVWLSQIKKIDNLINIIDNVLYLSLKLNSNNLTTKYTINQRKTYLYSCKKKIVDKSIYKLVKYL
tara:strand:+ start:165 stop:1703 length:1539 start_codon:yes stop_codon:yes gene_type:complete